MHAIRRGEVLKLAARDSIVLGLDLQAGDTLDLGVFGAGSNLVVLSIQLDSRFQSPPLLIPEELRQNGSSMPITGATLVIPSLIPATTGRVTVLLLGVPMCLGGPPGSCRGIGTVEVELRRSAPVIVLSSGQGYMSYLKPEGTTQLDTIRLRNAGAGAADLQLSAGQPFSVPGEALPLSGPARAGDATAVSLGLTASVPGDYSDSLRLTGVPPDRFNAFAPRATRVMLRAYEARATRKELSTYLSHVAVNAVGEVIVGASSRFLSKLDLATGELTAWATAPGAVVGAGRGMQIGPDGALYVVAYVNPHWTLLRRTASGDFATVYAPMPSADYAVLPDGAIYVLASGDSARLVRVTQSGGMATATTIRSFGQVWAAKGVAFSSLDSSLYYGVGGLVYKRELNTETDRQLAGIAGAPIAVDASGRLYVESGTTIKVVDRDGSLVSTLYPPAWSPTSYALSHGFVIGIAGPSVWTLPVP